jgi:hypothetical protein
MAAFAGWSIGSQIRVTMGYIKDLRGFFREIQNWVVRRERFGGEVPRIEWRARGGVKPEGTRKLGGFRMYNMGRDTNNESVVTMFTLADLDYLVKLPV